MASPADNVFLCGLRCACETYLTRNRFGRSATSPVDVLDYLELDLAGEHLNAVWVFPYHVEKQHTLGEGVSARSVWFASWLEPRFATRWTIENHSTSDYVLDLRVSARFNVNYLNKFALHGNDTAQVRDGLLQVADAEHPHLHAALKANLAWNVCRVRREGEPDWHTDEVTTPGQVLAECQMRQIIRLGETAEFVLVVAGAAEPRAALQACDALLADPQAAFELDQAQWKAQVQTGAMLMTPDPNLNVFHAHSKLWGYKGTRIVPLGAPYDLTRDDNAAVPALTASPDYHGIFANDCAESCWEYGSLGPDIYPVLKNTLDILYHHDTPESVEVDPIHATGTPWRSPLRIGERPQWVIGAGYLVLWSGQYVEDLWPGIQAVLARFTADDADHDHLDDYSDSPFPEQPDPRPYCHEMLYANVFWCHAFKVGSEVAALVGDDECRRAYLNQADRIAQAIEARFGNAAGYASWLDPQHRQHPHRGHNIVMPLQYGLASPERALLTLENIFDSPLWSANGPLAIEPGFELAGSRFTWGFTRWGLISALFRYHHVAKALELTTHWIAQEAQGHFQAPEAIPPLTATGRGFVWTAGRAQRALLFGLFGLDLVAEGLRVAPRLPDQWTGCSSTA
jgi:hypothetical protein